MYDSYFSENSIFYVFIAATNVIIDMTVNGKTMDVKSYNENPQCVLCEFVMKEIQDQLKDNKTDVSITVFL